MVLTARVKGWLMYGGPHFVNGIPEGAVVIEE